MRWIDHSHDARPVRRLVAALALVLIILWTPAPQAQSAQERLSVYTQRGSFSVPLVETSGHAYVSLLDLLQPLGDTTARQDGNKWKLRCNDVDAEFQDGSSRAKVRNRNLELAAPFRFQDGRGMVPLSSLVSLLSPLLQQPLELHETARRLFVGGVAVHFTSQLVHAPGDAVVLSFSAPVNPSIATEPGRLRMTFVREPVLHASPSNVNFEDKTFSSLSYREGAGVAELVINSSVPLLARFSADRTTITVGPVVEITAQPRPQPPPASAPAPTPSVSAVAPPASQPPPATAPPAPSAPPPVVIVDASHGGTERGAALSDTLAEKDVALSIAIRLHTDLEARGLRTTLLRNTDSALTLDQRAILANTSRARFYVCIHVGSVGTGVRLYTALLPPVVSATGPFLPWDTAQARFLPASLALSGAIAGELSKANVANRQMPAPLPPLNNIAAAAVAVEVVPPGGDIGQVNSPAYQEQVAAAIAAGVARAQQGATP